MANGLVPGVGGYGGGGLQLTPDSGPALESGLSMAMAAAGTRGELVAGGASGFELAFKADAAWTCWSEPAGYNFSRLNTRSGMTRTISMIQRQIPRT